MVKEKILVIGASGQIGVELTLALRKIYGNANVVRIRSAGTKLLCLKVPDLMLVWM
jgi:nucleoside-diphosphate-sugar epimerase